jgi:hypothetical protein
MMLLLPHTKVIAHVCLQKKLQLMNFVPVINASHAKNLFTVCSLGRKAMTEKILFANLL